MGARIVLLIQSIFPMFAGMVQLFADMVQIIKNRSFKWFNRNLRTSLTQFTERKFDFIPNKMQGGLQVRHFFSKCACVCLKEHRLSKQNMWNNVNTVLFCSFTFAGYTLVYLVRTLLLSRCKFQDKKWTYPRSANSFGRILTLTAGN